MAVTLYRQFGKGKARRYQKVNLGRGRRPTNLAGPYFLRYSLADGIRPWEAVGADLDAAIDAQKRKQAYFEALDANVPVIQDQDEFRLAHDRHPRESIVSKSEVTRMGNRGSEPVVTKKNVLMAIGVGALIGGHD